MAIGQERTLALIEYTQQTALMRDKPTSNVTAHMFHRHENSIAGLPGVHLNVSLEDREDEVWLVVNRLHETKPPEPTSNFLKAWIKLSNTPFEEPELKPHIEIQELIDLGLEVLPDLDSDIQDSASFDPKQLVFLDTFENLDEVKTQLNIYVNNLWSPWAINEKSRRESISLYATLFTLKQQLEGSIVESQLELVWGIGIAVWKMGDVSVSYPLVSRLVELSFNELTMDIVVRPRNIDSRMELEIYTAEYNQAVTDLEHIAKDFFSRTQKVRPREIDSRMELEIYTAEYNQAVTDLEHIAKDFFSRTQRVRPREIDSRLELEMYFAEYTQAVPDRERIAKDSFSRTQNTFSPFDRASFEPLLRVAVTHLDSRGVFWPTQTTPDDRALPEADNALKVTDTWVLFARPRSNSLFIQDLDRLKKQVEESLELPAALTAIVTDPTSKHTERELPNFRGLSNVQRSTGKSSNPTKASDLFFLKPYNKEQARIIQMLEHSPGVVVQGPPGTGKTHTIANIICHSLAQGHRVLVTSMRVPALAVLHEHLPKAIQPLAISFLSSEKEGMKQFEYAVEKIAAEVQGIDRTSLGREISLLESHIDSLHGWLVKINRSISKWALCNLSKLDIDGELIDPQEAAKELVQEKGSFEWIDDELTIRLEHAPKFTDKHIIELRAVRRLLGKDLDYLGKKLPQISKFPDSRHLLKVHQDLSQLSKLKEELEQGEVSIMANSSKEIYQLAASLVKLISYLKNLKSELGQPEHNWHRTLRIKLKIGHSQDMFQMFEELANELNSTVADNKRFLEKPVETPNDIDLEDELVLGLRNLTVGKSAFGIASLIIKGDLKKKLQKIKLLGAKPNGNEEWTHVLEYVEHLKKLRTLVTRWNALASEVSVAQIPADPKHIHLAVEALAIYRKTKIMIAVEQEIDDKANVVLPSWNHGSDTTNSDELLKQFEGILTNHLTQNRLAETWVLKERFKEVTATCSGRIVDNIILFFAETLGNKDIPDTYLQATWTTLMEELRRVQSLAPHLATAKKVCDSIKESGAPKWAEKLSSLPTTGTIDNLIPSDWRQAWRLKRLSNFLDSIDAREELKRLTREYGEAEMDLARTYQDIVSKRTTHKLVSNATPDFRQALAAFNAIPKKGKRTGKRAIRYRRDARAAVFRANSAIIPCWIMPHYRVSESLPAELGAFDLVIIDEASQSDFSALPTLLRAQKVLIFGDDKQVSPEGVGLEEDKIRNLIARFLGSQVETFRAQMTPERSIYDLCKVVFAEYSVMLKEHFRCVGPIIEYSKREFYNHELKPLRLPRASERIDPPLIDVFVEDGFICKTDNTNTPEARFIVDEILAICADQAMIHRTIGVVSLLGDKQALKVWKMLEQELGPEKIAKFKIACGDARTFQGKERNIMFLSMVIAPNETITPILRDTSAQCFNVAASRAQDRMYLVRSVELDALRETDKLRRELVSHFAYPFSQKEKQVDDLRELCESPFEREMYDELTGRGYRVKPQVKAGDFRIDMVVEGDNDARLAVECDGDRYHGPKKWDEDMFQQRILERAGWRFWRCFASIFVMNREEVLQDLVQILTDHGVHPIGADRARRS